MAGADEVRHADHRPVAGPNPTLTLVANCLAWPGLVDLSWLTLTQACGLHEFATSVNTRVTSRQLIFRGCD
jgi:hypothetical protein